MLIYRPFFPRQRTRFHRERAATERGAGRAAGGARAAARLTFRVAVTVLAAADVTLVTQAVTGMSERVVGSSQ